MQSPIIQNEWLELQEFKAKEWRDETLSARNRLFRLLTSPTLTRVMGLPERTLDLREIVEFQDFVSPAIHKLLDQVRKFDLFTILSHQRFGQLTDDLIDALSNCRIKAVFGGLPVKWAHYMAEEIFINELDPLKVKCAIYQTKFWPKYARDTVYSSASERGKFHGRSDQPSSMSGGGQSFGQFFELNDWFGGGSSSGMNFYDASSAGSSSAEGDSENEMEGEADIPIFIPVPFKELSSIQHFTFDEQLIQLTAALKEQYPRHCFIKIHQQKTQPMLVPTVEEFTTPKRNAAWYEQKLLAAAKALPAAEVDRLLDERKAVLIETAKMARSERGLPDDFHE